MRGVPFAVVGLLLLLVVVVTFFSAGAAGAQEMDADEPPVEAVEVIDFDAPVDRLTYGETGMVVLVGSFGLGLVAGGSVFR